MGYWLLDRRNPNGDHFYRSRNRKLKAIVVHCTAGLEDSDLIGPDNSAEGTANYAASTPRDVSWHSGSDSDTFIDLLPYSFTAWQCVNYNSSTAGHEISKRNMDWTLESDKWVDKTIRTAALGSGGNGGLRSKAIANGIPFRRATKAELDHAIATDGPPVGFVTHADLDPTRRTDPGRNFPWTKFLNYLKSGATPATKPTPPKETFLMGLSEMQQSQMLDGVMSAQTDAHAAKVNTERILSQFNPRLGGSLVSKLNRTGLRLAELQATVSDDEANVSAVVKAQVAEALAEVREIHDELAALSPPVQQTPLPGV